MDGDREHTPRPDGTFELNRPTLVALLYLGTYFTGITAFVGVVLAYVWRRDAAEWEATHYRYLIRTFWIALLVAAIGCGMLSSIIWMIGDRPGPSGGGALLVIVAFVLATPVLLADAVWIGVRCVLSIVNAMQKRPMPRPGAWLI